MTMQRESSGGSAFNTVLVFLSGVAIGLLLAPKSGSETREDLQDLINKGREKGEEMLGKVRDTTEAGAEQVERAAEGSKESFYQSGKYT